MNEIEKLYKNAGAEPSYRFCIGCPYSASGECPPRCPSPPFTAEKQIELIERLAKNKFVVYNNLGCWHVGTTQTYSEELGIVCKHSAMNIDSFDEALAKLINSLWQDLTDEEKQQIKEILSV